MGKIQILDVTVVAEKRKDNGAETVFENTMIFQNSWTLSCKFKKCYKLQAGCFLESHT